MTTAVIDKTVYAVEEVKGKAEGWREKGGREGKQ